MIRTSLTRVHEQHKPEDGWPIASEMGDIIRRDESPTPRLKTRATQPWGVLIKPLCAERMARFLDISRINLDTTEPY